MEKYKEEEKDEEELNADANTVSESKSQKESGSEDEEENEDKPEEEAEVKEDRFVFTLEELLPLASELLLNQRYSNIDIEQLIECFKILDKEGKGYVEVEVFKTLIAECEYSFSEEEFESFFKFAITEKDPNKIFYNEYILDYKEMINTHIDKLFNK